MNTVGVAFAAQSRISEAQARQAPETDGLLSAE